MLGHDAERLALQNVTAFVEARSLDAPRLRALIAGAANDFGELPDRRAPLDELVEFCAAAPSAIAIALVREAYVHGGWAVAAATLVAGDELPGWDELVEAVSRVASARFADAACAELESGEPVAERLDAIAVPAPGRDLVAAAFVRIADAVALATSRAAPARARLAHALATADAVLASAPLPPPPIERDVDPAAFVAWLAIEAATAWTWASVDGWRHRDSLAPGKAIVRVAGLPIASLLDEVRVAIATELDALAPVAWRRAIAEARAELPAVTSSPLVDAIVALADAAAAYAAHRLADASDRRAVLAELLGDPRGCPGAWQGSAAAIRAALEAAR